MQNFPPLESMGTRIMLLGPTNSGKSTLAVALKNKLRIDATHLDQLRHLPNTNWEVRPDDDFAALHDQAIQAPNWIIEGNYTKLAPQRFQRATGIVVINDSLITRYRRYFYRTLLQKTRPGALEGGQDFVNRAMLGWLWKSRNAAGRYKLMAEASGLPHVFVDNRRELAQLYATWGLTP